MDDYKIRLLENDMILTADWGDRTPEWYPAGTVHKGMDFVSNTGALGILCPAPGTVVEAYNGCLVNEGMGTQWENCGGGRGNFLKIYHGEMNGLPLYTLYYHLLPGTMAVAEGQRLERGTYLGKYGNTGLSAGDHLHFEVWNGTSNTQHIDPRPFLLGEVQFPGQEPEEVLEWINDDRYLNTEEQINNAKIIYRTLNKEGWSFDSIMAVLGNMSTESKMSPGLNERDGYGGFGLVQWTPGSIMIDWAEKRGYEPDDGDAQLERLIWESEWKMGDPKPENRDQWYPYPDPLNPDPMYDMTFKEYTKLEGDLDDLVLIFMRNYLRPHEPTAKIEERQEMAHFFAETLKDWDPEGGGTGAKPIDSSFGALFILRIL